MIFTPKTPTPSMLTAPVGQTFLDNDNPLYNANPADKVMDPDKPYLKGPFHAFAGDLVNPETVMISFVVTLNRETRVPDAIIPAAAVRRVRNRGILSRKLYWVRHHIRYFSFDLLLCFSSHRASCNIQGRST